ncbi:MAG: FHA domain-containing protein [Coriobacteriales bacterium]|jgi:hypothetical protein|nr:FHA domain-containing protein [Coriobacteriales bacterium]
MGSTSDNNATVICPVCNTTVSAAGDVCPTCGFRFAGATAKFQAVEPADVPANAAPHDHCEHPQLTLLKGPQQGQVFNLGTLPITIGRDPKCDIFLNNMTVSRKHAVIERHADQIVIRDCASLNGVWVDKKIVDEAELSDGSLVQIGTFVMQFGCA